LDAQRLKDSFAEVAKHGGDQVVLFFYADLFWRAPETRDMFPVSMAAQRDRLLGALARIVSDVDNVDALVPYLRGLGRDHRKFGTLAEHYGVVGVSLLTTLAHFAGDAWTEEVAADWKAAYTLVAQVMMDAAEEERDSLPWWDATVISHERRSMDISVLRVAPLHRLPYAPGQSVAVESELCPRTWRFLSMANAPREDGTVDFHVRIIDGGALSGALARKSRPGSRLRLGPPVGSLTLGTGTGRDILMVAGSTGLAPLKALIEQVAGLAVPRQVHLFFGAAGPEDLYDLPDLEKMAAQYQWLTLTHGVSCDPEDSPGYAGERGMITDVVSRHGPWQNHDAYVCGSTAMVQATARRLASHGVPGNQIHIEDFGWKG
jgi:NAD(P)H-flavin reductase/hemoglobin-like flavoprotein